MTRFMLALLLLTSPVLAQSNEVKPGTAKPQMQTSAWIRPAIQGEEPRRRHVPDRSRATSARVLLWGEV